MAIPRAGRRPTRLCPTGPVNAVDTIDEYSYLYRNVLNPYKRQ